MGDSQRTESWELKTPVIIGTTKVFHESLWVAHWPLTFMEPRAKMLTEDHQIIFAYVEL